MKKPIILIAALVAVLTLVVAAPAQARHRAPMSHSHPAFIGLHHFL
jgi:hypothetical protein